MEDKKYESFVEVCERNKARVEKMKKRETPDHHYQVMISLRRKRVEDELFAFGCDRVTEDMIDRRMQEEDFCDTKGNCAHEYEKNGLMNDPAKRIKGNREFSKEWTIVEYGMDKKEIRRWPSYKEAMKDLGFTIFMMSRRLAQGREGKPVGGKYYAKFKD